MCAISAVTELTCFLWTDLGFLTKSRLKATLSDPQHVLISWLGRPGVRLQSCANPATGPWEEHPETDGLSATNWRVAEGGSFFGIG
jgi:hypothetical protein